MTDREDAATTDTVTCPSCGRPLTTVYGTHECLDFPLAAATPTAATTDTATRWTPEIGLRPISVPCPSCDAEVGRACFVMRGSTTLAVDTHKARQAAAGVPALSSTLGDAAATDTATRHTEPAATCERCYQDAKAGRSEHIHPGISARLAAESSAAATPTASGDLRLDRLLAATKMAADYEHHIRPETVIPLLNAVRQVMDIQRRVAAFSDDPRTVEFKVGYNAAVADIQRTLGEGLPGKVN